MRSFTFKAAGRRALARSLGLAAALALGFGCSADDGSNGNNPSVAPDMASVLPGTGTGAGGATTPGTGFTTPGTASGGLGSGQPASPTPGSDVMGPINGAAGVGGGTVAPSTGSMPCEVSDIVQTSCQKCHGATPNFGAPMSLVTLADFQKDYMPKTTMPLVGQTVKVYELARIRINGEMNTTKMPQGAPLSDTQLKTLNDWLVAGAPAGATCDTSSPMGAAGAGGGMDMGTDTGAVTNPNGDNIQDQCTGPDAFEPLVAQGDETCYDFTVHDPSSTQTKFSVPNGESYNEYYYDVPWPSGSMITRFGTKFDQKPVLHHWLMFANNNVLATAGQAIPNVTGTTLGTDSELIAGWAVGGCNTTYPSDMGVKLPDSYLIMVQWHNYNTTGRVVQDGSAAQVCVVPEGSRPHTAGITFLGTENISVPPGSKADSTGSCINTTNAPITIIGFTPHMHTIGIEMKSVVQRASGGAPVTVFDQPFQFDYQTNYMFEQPLVLEPGDTIISTCTFQNKGAGTVGFGQSTNQEMCYQFTVAYPYGALNNGVGSLIGATNTCWQPGE